MKTQILLFCIFLAIATFVKSAEINVSTVKSSSNEGSYSTYDYNISTAIVYTDKKNRNVVYKSLKTGEETILVSGTDGPAAISENADCLMYKQKWNFCFKNLPGDEVIYATFGKARLVKDRRIEKAAISNLILAPDKNVFFYEKNVYDSKRNDTLHAITSDSKESEEEGLVYQFVKSEMRKPYYELSRCFGNTANFNPEAPNSRVCNVSLPQQEAFGRLSIKRNTCYFAMPKPEKWIDTIWSSESPWREKDEKIIAFIYSTGPNQFGPIQLIDNSARKFYHGSGATTVGRKQVAGFYEINLNFFSFSGLAFRPDGLTFWSGDTVSLISYEELNKWIKNSSIIDLGGKEFPVNYIFNPEVSVVIQGVSGDKPYWQDKDTFLFRSKNGELCVWQKGQTRVLLKEASSEFCYCRDLLPKKANVLVAENGQNNGQNTRKDVPANGISKKTISDNKKVEVPVKTSTYQKKDVNVIAKK